MALRTNLKSALRVLTLENARIATAYLRAPGAKKLQIGGGSRHLPGWLNSDLYPSRGVLELDATRRLPFPDAAFDFVYSEHMIEHIRFEDGLRMLKEVHRVLRPGGAARVATPDLDFLAALCAPDLTPRQRDYVEWAAREFVPEAPEPRPAFVVNNFVRAWGHQFIYDAGSLELAMRSAGFASVGRRRIMESDFEELRNLENVGRLPPGYVELETLICEAVR